MGYKCLSNYFQHAATTSLKFTRTGTPITDCNTGLSSKHGDVPLQHYNVDKYFFRN